MPENGTNFNPIVAATDLLSPKDVWFRRYLKSEAALVGLSWFALTELAGMASGSIGHPVELSSWGFVSAGVGIVASVLSRWHIGIFGLRVIIYRAYRWGGLIDDDTFAEFKGRAEKAYLDRLNN